MSPIISLPLPAPGSPLSPEQAMRLAISEAQKGASGASPNPLVGAVVLDRQGGFLSAGYHAQYGGPHAEVHALQGLSAEQLKGAQVYVTLEPCAHKGKTPSCAQMMAKLPLGRVVFGLIDPNPLVAGQGAEILRQAGIPTEVFSSQNSQEQDEIHSLLEQVCEVFLWNFRYKKVFVALKMATSLDGQVALQSGESQWITGPESRQHVHFLRSVYDAVLIGRGTLEKDNPSLDIRHPHITKKNKVVVLDSGAHLLPRYKDFKLTQTHDQQDIFWCVAETQREQVTKMFSAKDKTPQICFIRTLSDEKLDIVDVLKQLWDRGLRSIMVEGGGRVASAFISCQLVNRLYVFQAPIIMGSGGSQSWTASIRIPSMSQKLQIRSPRFLVCGDDFMVTGVLQS